MSTHEWRACPVIIPYFGGKFELSRRLVPMLPPHERYIEMFAGGLSMFFRKTKVKWNVVNDIDNDVVNLYISVLEEFDKLSEYIHWYPRSRTLFNEIKKELKEQRDIVIPDAKRAARYYYQIKTAFNKNVHGSFSKQAKADWGGDKLINELKHSRKYFSQTTIESLDFRELVDRYKPRKDDCWYLDPPYWIAGERKDYYRYAFGEQEHKDLKDVVDKIDSGGGKFMLSYDNRDEVRTLYRDYNVQEIKTKYSGATEARDKEFCELLIMNYSPIIQEDLF